MALKDTSQGHSQHLWKEPQNSRGSSKWHPNFTSPAFLKVPNVLCVRELDVAAPWVHSGRGQESLVSVWRFPSLEKLAAIPRQPCTVPCDVNTVKMRQRLIRACQKLKLACGLLKGLRYFCRFVLIVDSGLHWIKMVCFTSFLYFALTNFGSDGKQSACNAEDLGLIPGSGRSPGEGHSNPFQYSGESQGQRSLVGYSPRGHKESDTTEQITHRHTHTQSQRNKYLT